MPEPTRERMRIVHTESSPGWGGQEMRIVAESEGLSRHGHSVTIVAPAEASILAEAAARGLPTVALPIARKRVPALRAMRRYLLANRPAIDVVNTHSSTDSWLVALACASMRDAPGLVRTRHVSSALSVGAATRWLYARAPDHVVVTGERLRETLCRNLGVPPSRVTSIPTGIDLARFRPRDRDAARAAHALGPGPWIGILAALRNWKGHAYLFEACKTLQDAGRELNVLVQGDGPQRANLERKARELGIAERIRFTGHRADPEHWLPALDVFVLPSYGDEGVSQAAMQAMACGLPVVVTDVGGMTDAVRDGETGLFVPTRDAPAIAAALVRLLDDAVLRARLGTAAAAHARVHFGQDLMLDRMQAIFAEVVRGRAR